MVDIRVQQTASYSNSRVRNKNMQSDGIATASLILEWAISACMVISETNRVVIVDPITVFSNVEAFSEEYEGEEESERKWKEWDGMMNGVG